MFSKAALFFNGFNKPVEILSKVLFGMPSVIFYLAAKILSLPFIGIKEVFSNLIQAKATPEKVEYWKDKILCSSKEFGEELIQNLARTNIKTSYDNIFILIAGGSASDIFFGEADGLFGLVHQEGGIDGITAETLRRETKKILNILVATDSKAEIRVKTPGYLACLKSAQPLLGPYPLKTLSLDEYEKIRCGGFLGKSRLETIFS
jgi:hypothetical protein